MPEWPNLMPSEGGGAGVGVLSGPSRYATENRGHRFDGNGIIGFFKAVQPTYNFVTNYKYLDI